MRTINHHAERGLTMIELLAAMGVVALLATLVSAAVSGVQRKGNETKELSNARQLMAAYHRYSGDNNGELLPGYGDFPATDDKGAPVSNPINQRYPWRLAPYLSYDLRILWGTNGDDNLRKLVSQGQQAYVYGVSVQPALGINAMFVGGDYQTLSPVKAKVLEKYGQFCVTRMGQTSAAAQLIVFASAASEYQGGKLTGYFKIESPNLTSRRWAPQFSAKDSPDQHGFVDFRYNERAVAAMLDGHVELLTFEQMEDMRRWAPQAAELDNRHWSLGQIP